MRHHLRTLVLSIGLAAGLTGLISCGTPTVQTPSPPNSPQTTVATLVKTVADTNLAGIRTVITLRDGGKITQAAAKTIQDWQAFIATTDKQIGLILAKSEPWSDQKREIVVLLGTVTAPALATNIDPGAQAVVSQIMTLIAQIRVQVVGG